MVEALGTAAAVIEILKVLRGGIEFCQSFKEAPRELQRFANHFRLLSTEFELFLLITRRSRKWLSTNGEDVCLLNDYVDIAKIALKDIRSELKHEVRGTTFKNRLRWSLYGKAKAGSLLVELGRLESSMNLMMGFVSSIKLRRTQLAGPKDGLAWASRSAQKLNMHRPKLRGLRQPQVMLRIHAKHDKPALHSSNMQLPCQRTVVLNNARGVGSRPSIAPSSLSKWHGRTLPSTHPQAPSRLDCWVSEHASRSRSASRSTLVSSEAPIMIAARDGDVRTLRRILREDRDARYCSTIDKLTPIGVAIQHGQLAVVELLLDNKGDMNRTFGRWKITALGQALRCRQFDIAKLLVEHGASFASRNISGWTPLFYLWAAETNPSATQYLELLRKRPDFDLLHQDGVDSDGWKAMHRAACFGTADDVELLIMFGLDPFARIRSTEEETECNRWTVLHVAVWYGAQASVKLLSSQYVCGPGIDIMDDNGYTPLHLAILRKRLDIAAILLQHGADSSRKTHVVWPTEASEAVGARYNAVMLAAEAGRGFQQEFGALLTVKSHVPVVLRAEPRRDGTTVKEVATEIHVVESEPRMLFPVATKGSSFESSSVGVVQVDGGCRRTPRLAIALLVLIVVVGLAIEMGRH
ncbi:hypothetical protein OHC33_003234 [Knufia fluminis]|uniref:Ankyrin n=1 Tax=Knufia fluminis TaxID=191047 RepID=A0AAN8EHE4_9EURO|nr:hypothetical protein OHC33_003234 [Knufia fluminis]